MTKFIVITLSMLLGLSAANFLGAQPADEDEPGPPLAKHKKKADVEKKKGEPGPIGDLTKAYDLLRRLRADQTTAGPPEERLRAWTDRATKYYRDGLKAFDRRDEFHAHEYGAIAHDLSRAADHARKAALFDHQEPELPPPPPGHGPENMAERSQRDLRRAYERILESESGRTPDASYYLNAARDLYSAARRDIEAGRNERGGEMARAAEAMTHVIDHLGHLSKGRPEERETPPDRIHPGPEPKRPNPALAPPLPPQRDF